MKMKATIVLLCLLLIVFVEPIASKRITNKTPGLQKKKAKKKNLFNNYPEVSSHKRPNKVSTGLYCEAC